MTDKTTETAPQVLEDTDLEVAVGGRMTQPPVLKPIVVRSTDPCDGGE